MNIALILACGRGGRLAEYKYYGMAPIIEKAFSLWIG